MDGPDPADAGLAPTDNLTRRTLRGIQWTYLQTGVSSVLQIVVAGVLARLLTPQAFGLLAIANLTLKFVNYLARAGIEQAVVQKPDLGERDIRAAFGMSAVLGVVFATIVWVIAPVAADLLSAPEGTIVIRVMGLSLVLYGTGATADALLRRALRFRTVALRDISSYVVGYAGVGLTAAWLGAGVWALVAASLTQTGLKALLSYTASPHPVTPTTALAPYRALLGFGGRVSFISFLEFLGGELDTLAVGRYVGTSPLGLYNRGYLLARLPIQQLMTSFSKVFFPALSAVQTEPERLRGAYLSALRITSSVLVPMTAGMAVAAREIVLVVLGEQWVGAIPVLPWILASSALGLVTHFSGITAEARAVLNPKIAISLLKVAVLAGLLVLAADQDLWAFAAALAGAQVFAFAAYAWLGARVTEQRTSRVLRAFLPAILAAAGVGGSIALVRWSLASPGTPVVVTLLGEIATGAVVLLLMFLGPLRSTREEIGSRLANAGMMTGPGRLARMLRRVFHA